MLLLMFYIVCYDRENDLYVFEGGILKFLFVDDEYVVVLGSVGCCKMGLMCMFLVVVVWESFMIGRLDIENVMYEVMGKIVLFCDGEECFECWLVDGLMVVVRY